jgi:hypothetical protein
MTPELRLLTDAELDAVAAGWNPFKVVKGAAKVVGGLLGKAAGAVSIGTGVGILAGVAAMVGGQIMILDGVEEIDQGFNETHTP